MLCKIDSPVADADAGKWNPVTTSTGSDPARLYLIYYQPIFLFEQGIER